jgi:BirA family transcriptional regulator, biotin operon repressor / biotin---[acetyl-CoA-carboxylase] ligase
MIIGSNLLFYENLPSTNNLTSDLLKQKRLKEGTVIHTNYQSAGRGQAGITWESEDGKNLLISIVLFPSFIHAEDQFNISMTISLGICDFLLRFIPDSSIKWPNDIYVNNDKIAGILIENSVIGDQIEFTIAGIGLNINQEKFLSSAPNPVSLKMLTGMDYDLSACLTELNADLDKRYKQMISGKLEQIKKEYVSKLFYLNEWHHFRDINGIFTGKILTVDEFGRLTVEKLNHKTDNYSFKEIEFIL